MTGHRSDVKHASADGKNVVDLARVDQADQSVSHDNDVKVGSREGS